MNSIFKVIFHSWNIFLLLWRGSPTLTTFFFLVDEERDDPNTTISGPTSARQQMAFHCRTVDGPTLNAGLVTLRLSGDPD